MCYEKIVQVQWASDGATDVRDFSKRSSRAKYIWPKRNGQDWDPNSELAILRGFPLRLLPRRPHPAHRSPFSANSTTFFRICHSQVRVSRRVPFLDRARWSGCTLVRIRSKGNLPFLNLNQRQLHEFTRGPASNPRGVYLTMNEHSCHPVDTNVYSDRAFFKYHNDLRPLNHFLSSRFRGNDWNVALCIFLCNIKCKCVASRKYILSKVHIHTHTHISVIIDFLNY